MDTHIRPHHKWPSRYEVVAPDGEVIFTGSWRECYVEARKLDNEIRKGRTEPYSCPDCGHKWDQEETWDEDAQEWKFSAEPYGFCRSCTPDASA